MERIYIFNVDPIDREIRNLKRRNLALCVTVGYLALIFYDYATKNYAVLRKIKKELNKMERKEKE